MSIDQLRELLLLLIALILSISVHEFGHALVATKLGDGLPGAQGRLTLNPVRHVDPIGTLLFPAIVFFASGGAGGLLGWGRPVQTNTLAYTRRFSRRTGHMLVAVAGPAMNLVMAAVVSAAVVVLTRTGVMGGALAVDVLRHLVALNLVLMFFNLLPIPPLDGGAVLAWLLPARMQSIVEFLERWGFLILLFLLMTRGIAVLMAPAYFVIDLWFGAVSRLVAG